MNTNEKISPFQLICLLLCGSIYNVLIVKPKLSEPGSALIAALLSPMMQLVLIITMLWLFDRLSARGIWRRRWLLKSIWAAGVVFSAYAAIWTSASCGSFISSEFYRGGQRSVFILLILAAGVFTALQDIEGVARTAPIVLLLSAAGLLLLGLGTAGALRFDYLPPLAATVNGTALLSLDGCMMNFEIVALIFLQSSATKRLKKSAVAAWLGISALLWLSVMLLVMLCFGRYTENISYPLLMAARCARLTVLPQLDPILMGVWILLGLVKTSMFLFITFKLWRQLFPNSVMKRKQTGTAAASIIFCAMLLSGCGTQDSSISAKTIVTALEVEQGVSCTVSAEYRIVGSGEGTVNYGIYSGDGDTFEDALKAIEMKESVRLFTEGCRTVTLLGISDCEELTALLLEISRCGGIRPLTAVFLCDSELLTENNDKAVSIGLSLEKLFIKNGGMLEERYTLKDSIATLWDTELELALPVVMPNNRGDGVWFVNFENFTSKNLC